MTMLCSNADNTTLRQMANTLAQLKGVEAYWMDFKIMIDFEPNSDKRVNKSKTNWVIPRDYNSYIGLGLDF